jgi:hypothetical protein
MRGQTARLRQVSARSPTNPSDKSIAASQCRAPPGRTAPGRRIVEAPNEFPPRDQVSGPRRRGATNASPAPASPKVPVTANISPACAPLRRSAVPRGTCPRICTLTVKGPRVVSPPTSATPLASASSRIPRKIAQPVRIGAGHGQRQRRPRRRRAHGSHVAQIDGQRAMADRARIGALGKMPARHDGIHGRDQVPCPAAAQHAASSPIPRITPARASRAASRRMKKASISSNSPRSESLRSWRSYLAPAAVLVRPQLPRGSIQYGIDEFMPIGRAELLGSCTASASATRYGNSGATPIRAAPATTPHALWDRVPRRNFAQAGQTRIQCFAIRRDRREQAPEIVQIRPAPPRDRGELRCVSCQDRGLIWS